MARLIQNDSTLVDSAKNILSKASCPEELRMARSILIPALFPTSLAMVGKMIGRSRVTVARLRKKFGITQQARVLPTSNWGGRRKFNLSFSEERALLNEFYNSACKGNILEVGLIKEAYEQKVGEKKVNKTTIYRMLSRHGWRKIAPRRKHAKANKAKQEAFKKTFLVWLPPQSRNKLDTRSD